MNALRRFHLLLLLAHRYCIRRPKTILISTLILFALSLMGLQHQVFWLSFDYMLDPDLKTSASLISLQENYDDHHPLLLRVFRKDHQPLTERDICDLELWTTRLQHKRDDIARIFSPLNIRQGVNPERNKLWYFKAVKLNCEAASDQAPDWSPLADSHWVGNLVSRDLSGRDILFEIVFLSNDRNPKFGSFDPIVVDEVLDDLRGEFLRTRPHLDYQQGGLAAVENFTKIGYGWIGLLNIAVLLVLLSVIYFLYSSWRACLIAAFNLIVGTLMLQGLMANLGIAVDVLNNNLFLMLAVSTIEDLLFLGFVAQKNRGASWRMPFRQTLMPCFLTSLTTAIGFWSLGVTDMKIMRNFGWLAGTGAMIEWTLLFMVVPAAMKQWSWFRDWVGQERRRLLNKIDSWMRFNLPRPVALASLLIIPFGIWCATKLRTEERPERVFSPSHQYNQFMRDLGSTRGFWSSANLVFAPGMSMEEQAQLEERVTKHAIVSSYESYLDVYRFTIRKLPERWHLLVDNEMQNSAVFNRWHGKDDSRRTLLYLNTSDVVQIEKMRHDVDSVCRGRCGLAGIIVTYGEWASRIESTLFESLWVSIILVCGVLLVILWQLGLRDYFPILTALLWGPSALVVLLWLFDVPVYFVTCLFAATVMGLAGDNTIQYLWGKKSGPTAARMEILGGASFLVSITMALMAVTMQGAYFAPARTLGILLAGGILLTFAGDFYVLKALLRRD